MAKQTKVLARCTWPGQDEKMIQYHDLEWGTPCRDDQKLFEYVVLDTFQAGLSWKTILHKRENFRSAFAGFNPQKIARFGSRDIARLLKDAGIIRNRQKIIATIKNAQAFFRTQQEFGTFSKYVWQFVGGETVRNSWKKDSQLRAHSKESDAMSADMKKRGFSFVGTTICHAFMQGAGLINDHLITCFRWKEVGVRKR